MNSIEFLASMLQQLKEAPPVGVMVVWVDEHECAQTASNCSYELMRKLAVTAEFFTQAIEPYMESK